MIARIYANTKATLATQLKMNETKDMKTIQKIYKREIQENLEVIKTDLTTNITMVGIEVKTTRKVALTQQSNLN
jgi:hypothetical protein